MAGSDLAHAMRDGWAASVAVVECDVAFSEDTAAVFARNRSKGKPAMYDHLGQFVAPFNRMSTHDMNVGLAYGCSK